MQIELRFVVEETEYLRVVQAAQKRGVNPERFIKEAIQNRVNQSLVEQALTGKEEENND